MLKSFSKTVAVTAVTLTIGSSGAFALNDGKAKIKKYVYNVESAWATMVVTSSDGTKWDNIESGNLQFWARMEIDTKWPGAVNKVGVVLGNCSGNACKSFPILWSDNIGKRDYIHQRNFSVSTGLLQGSTAGLAARREEIIDTCNQHLAPDGATKRHEFQSSLTTTFIADTDKRDLGKILAQADSDTYSHPGEVDHSKSGDFTFNVVCKPHVRVSTTDDLKKEEGEFKTTDIDLFLSTFSGATTQPNPATTCKKGRILVRHKTSKPGPAKFKLWTKIGGNTTSKVVDAWSSHDGNGGYNAEYTEWVSVSEPTQIQAMAEDMVNSIGQSTQWKDLMLQCSSAPNGGGFTIDSDTGNPDNSDVPPQLQTLTGDFGFADHGAPKCNRVVNALATFRSPKMDNIHWSLDCKFQNKSGVVATQPHPDGGYMAVTLVPLNVTKTVDESCTLRTVAPYGPKDHVTKAHQFVCATPSGHGASSDLQIEPKPNGANKARLDTLKAANDARKKAEAERRRKAKIAAEKAAERNRMLEAAKKARLLKLQQERRRKAAAAAAKARANAIRALTAKRKNKVKVAPRRRSTTTAPAINHMMMMRTR